MLSLSNSSRGEGAKVGFGVDDGDSIFRAAKILRRNTCICLACSYFATTRLRVALITVSLAEQ